MVAVATAADLYEHGLPPGISFTSRLVESANATADTIEVNGHNIGLNKPVQFTVDDGGALPAPLVVDTVYYAKPVAGSDSLLQVAASEDVAAINLTTTGTAPFRIVRSISGVIEAAIAHWSMVVCRKLIGHVVPPEPPYPVELVGMVCKLSIRTVLRATRAGGFQQLIDEADKVEQFLAEISANGSTLRDDAATEGANIATGASPSACARAQRVIP